LCEKCEKDWVYKGIHDISHIFLQVKYPLPARNERESHVLPKVLYLEKPVLQQFDRASKKESIQTADPKLEKSKNKLEDDQSMQQKVQRVASFDIYFLF
jgi:hypothetical protein